MLTINMPRIKLFADGANIDEMKEAYERGIVQGFTTNPTLMRKANVADYESFAREAIEAIPDLPISFEVFSDEFHEMEREARHISSWGENVIVKIPITNTRGDSSLSLIRKLSDDGISLNITAILTLEQVEGVGTSLNPSISSIVSVFAGRIADTGVDPEPIMAASAEVLQSNPGAQLLWASSRELLNIFQAARCGCKIITVTPGILNKLSNIGRDLEEFSLATVRMFYGDAQAAGYKIVEKAAESRVVYVVGRAGRRPAREPAIHS